MTVGSLTRAAEILSMTQPAASHALRRLHDWVGEPLFLRSAAGMKPTPAGSALWPQVRGALQELEQALAPGGFDPRRDSAKFSLAMADATAAALAPVLVRQLQADAALADLRILPLTTRDPRAMLLEGRVDLAIGAFPGVMSLLLAHSERAPLHALRLHQAHYVCAMRTGHALAEGELTLDRFCAAQHLIVSLSGTGQGVVDDLLSSLDRSRRVVLSVNQYDTAIRTVAASDLVAVLPASPASASGADAGLLQRPLPLEVPPMTIEMLWLARRESSRHIAGCGNWWSAWRISAERSPSPPAKRLFAGPTQSRSPAADTCCMRSYSTARRIACGWLTTLACSGVLAATVEVQVVGSDGKPLPDAVVFLESPTAQAASKPVSGVEIEQVARKFTQRVSVVTVGSEVRFPNRDTVRHQVYSFSPVKTFELKLYAGTPSNPVLFDRPGIAVLAATSTTAWWPGSWWSKRRTTA